MRRYTYTHILKAKSNRSIYIPFLTFEHSKANTKVTSAARNHRQVYRNHSEHDNF